MRLVAVGTGFASTFFVKRWLESAGDDDQVVFLERGPRVPWQALEPFDGDKSTWIRRTGSETKEWLFSLRFGGSSHCWTGNTPRFLPADFELRSRYGVGRDWPFGYDELEPYYCIAEDWMGVAGPSEDTPFRRSRPYPLPSHSLTDPGRALKEAFPNEFFALPCARPTRPVGGRAACCNNGTCPICPINAKFTVHAGMTDLFADPRVEVRTGARVTGVDIVGNTARAVHVHTEQGDEELSADLVVLGANGLFNPVLLQQSGVEHPLLGRRLHEQRGVKVTVDLDGMESYQGSTIQTGHGYMLYDGAHRRERAGALLEVVSYPLFTNLRHEHHRWLERVNLKVIFEDLPSEDNFVAAAGGDRPEVHYDGHSDYVTRSLERLDSDLQPILAALPTESYTIGEVVSTEGHIQGTHVMGRDPDESVVDPDGLLHGVRNLLVLGSGLFPSCSPANPTLTLSALSIRAADRLVGRTQ